MTTKNLMLLILAWVMIIISSCEKDKEYPKKYYFDSYEPGEIKVYTNSGDKMEESEIYDIISKPDALFWQPSYQFDSWKVNIDILSESKAKIYNQDTIAYFDLTRKDEIIYFLIPGRLGYRAWESEMMKYSPLYINPDLDVERKGYFPSYTLIESNGELYIPFVTYVEFIIMSTGQLISQSGGGLNNVFDTTYLNKFRNYENLKHTVIYQDNKVILKER